MAGMRELSFPSGLSEIADRYDAILCDVWGVIHNGREAFHDACDALAEFRKTGRPVVLITNAPVQARYVERLFEPLGVRRDAYTLIVSSGDATRTEIEKRSPARVWRLTSKDDSERDETLFKDADVTLTAPEDAEFIVAMGLRDQFNDHPEEYRDELRPAAQKGMVMICANPDIQVRVGSRLAWTAGALARIYEEEGGSVIYPGKPHDAIYDLAEHHVARLAGRKIPPDRLLAIGDGPETDVKGAMRRGMDCIYVGTGLSQAVSGRFEADTRDLFERYGVTAAYAMTELRW